MKVEKYFVDIKNIIVNSDDYYAHRIDGNSQVEKEKLKGREVDGTTTES